MPRRRGSTPGNADIIFFSNTKYRAKLYILEEQANQSISENLRADRCHVRYVDRQDQSNALNLLYSCVVVVDTVTKRIAMRSKQ